MFKKVFPSQTKADLGSKDLKTIRQTLKKQFPNHESSVFDEILSNVMYQLEHPVNKSIMYFNATEPVLFDPDRKGTVYPTLYTLMKFPDLIPSFVIHTDASRFILAGADVMLPSIFRPTSTECYGSLHLKKIMAVRVYGNPIPFGVGYCCLSEDEFQLERGKALKVLHYYNDGLWMTGSLQAPNSGFLGNSIVATEDLIFVEDTKWYSKQCFDNAASKVIPSIKPDSLDCTSDNNKDKDDQQAVISDKCDDNGKESASQSKDLICESSVATSNSKQIDDQESMPHPDESDTEANQSISIEASKTALNHCFELLLLYTLQFDTLNSTFPVRISTIYSQMVRRIPDVKKHSESKNFLLKYEPAELVDQLLDPNTVWDIKKSGHKNISKLFQVASKTQYITLKKTRNEDTVLAINRSHFPFEFSAERPIQNDDDLKTKSSSPATSTKKKSTSETKNSGGKQQASSAVGGQDFLFIDCYQSKSPAISAILESVKPSISGTYYTMKQCEDAFYAYLDQHQLIAEYDTSLIRVDANLAQVCFSKAQRKTLSDGKSLSEYTFDVTEAATKFMSALQPYHAVKRSGDSKFIVYKDAMQPIQLSIETRYGRRQVTVIKNALTYGIDEKQFIENLQKTFASSASALVMPGSAAKCILVQGSFINEVKKMLIQQYGIPSKFIKAVTPV